MRQGEHRRQRRILIIDDNRSIHDDFRKILDRDMDGLELAEAEVAFFGEAMATTSGITYEIDDAFQGQEGLELVQQALNDHRPYDVAFVDMRMPPGWDGVETIEQLWQQDPELQVVICTAYSDYTWSEITERLGHNDKLLILKKPFDNAEVSQLAAALTEKRYLAQQASLKMGQLEGIVQARTRKLREAHQEVERLLSAISSLLIGIDAEGIVRRWNASAEQMFGINASDAIGKPFGELEIAWADRASVLTLLTAENGDSTLRREVEYYNRQDVTRLLGLSVYPIIDQHVTSGFLLLGMDITEQRLLEQKLQQAQKLEAIGQLAAGVAHEINTPIQFIGGNLYFLQQTFGKLQQLLSSYEALVDELEQEQSPESALRNITATGKAIKLAFLQEEIPHAFTEAIEGISRVTEIVQAMRSFSHPGIQARTPIDLNKAITDTLTIARNEWKSVAEVETDLDPDLPPVPCLSGELQQAILNLIINAAHAIGDVVSDGNSDRGTITVRTYHDEAWARVEIGDTGTGIPAAIQARIFDPFFTTKEVGKGTGQGLAIAHNIIANKHEGILTFETEADRGTTFCICLPLSTAEPSANMQVT